MADKVRSGRGVDDRDVQVKAGNVKRQAYYEAFSASTASQTDRLGREQQRRATAYARARGQL